MNSYLMTRALRAIGFPNDQEVKSISTGRLVDVTQHGDVPKDYDWRLVMTASRYREFVAAYDAEENALHATGYVAELAQRHDAQVRRVQELETSIKQQAIEQQRLGDINTRRGEIIEHQNAQIVALAEDNARLRSAPDVVKLSLSRQIGRLQDELRTTKAKATEDLNVGAQRISVLEARIRVLEGEVANSPVKALCGEVDTLHAKLKRAERDNRELLAFARERCYLVEVQRKGELPQYLGCCGTLHTTSNAYEALRFHRREDADVMAHYMRQVRRTFLSAQAVEHLFSDHRWVIRNDRLGVPYYVMIDEADSSTVVWTSNIDTAKQYFSEDEACERAKAMPPHVPCTVEVLAPERSRLFVIRELASGTAYYTAYYTASGSGRWSRNKAEAVRFGDLRSAEAVIAMFKAQDSRFTGEAVEVAR